MRNYVLDGIMGLCVADALGVPVEFMERRSLKRNPVVNMREYGTYNQPKGTWSDDTSMTLCTMDSLKDGLNYSDIMDKFLQWFPSGKYTPENRAFGIGKTTLNALIKYQKANPPLECGGKEERVK